MAAMPRLLSILSLLLVVWGLLCPAAQANPPRVAVLELQGKVEADLMALLSDKVRSGVLDATRGQDIIVMSRENMAVLAQDMGLDLSCIEGACEVETGRNIGAKYVVSGSVTEVGGLWLCTLKVHETENGALLATGEAEASGVLALRKVIPPEMTRLMGVALSGSSAAVATPAPVVAAQQTCQQIGPAHSLDRFCHPLKKNTMGTDKIHFAIFAVDFSLEVRFSITWPG